MLLAGEYGPDFFGGKAFTFFQQLVGHFGTTVLEAPERVETDTGKCLPHGVLEFKSLAQGAEPPASLELLGLRPIKLSKYLWATT